MRRFPSGQLLVGFCLLAAWVGSTVEQTGAQAPPWWIDYKCYFWTCQGTVGGCTLNSQYIIAGCYSSLGSTCFLSGARGVCPGTGQFGLPCEQTWPDCSGATSFYSGTPPGT